MKNLNVSAQPLRGGIELLHRAQIPAVVGVIALG
jgi:hypothetical protein